MTREEERIKQITKKLRTQGDVSFEDALFIWKMLQYEKFNPLSRHYAGINKSLLEWYKEVSLLVKQGKVGTFIESVPTDICDLSKNIKTVVNDILNRLDYEYKINKIYLNSRAYSYILDNVDDLSVFDMMFCSSGIGSESKLTMEIKRCGIHKKIINPDDLYVVSGKEGPSALKTIKKRILERADVPVIYREDKITTFKECKNELDRILNITEGDILSVLPKAREIFDENLRFDMIGYFDRINDIVSRLTENIDSPDFNFDRVWEARIKELAKKKDISKEEADDIFLDILLTCSFEGCAKVARSIFEEWLEIVYEKIKDGERGNFICSVPITGSRYFEKITTKIRSLLPPEYTSKAAYLFNIKTDIDSELGVNVTREGDKTMITLRRLGKIGDIVKNMKRVQNYPSFLYGNSLWKEDSEVPGRIWDLQDAFTAAKIKIMIKNEMPVVILEFSEDEKWWFHSAFAYVENSKEADEILNLKINEIPVSCDKLTLGEVTELVDYVYETKKNKKEALERDDWMSMER